MDAKQVSTFCDTAAQPLVQVGDYASADVTQRKAEDDALVCQLRSAASAIAVALDNVAAMTPPPMPAVQPRSPNVGAPS